MKTRLLSTVSASVFLATLVLLSCGSPHTEIPASAKDFCSQIHFGDSASLAEELKPLQDSMAAKTGIYVLEEGGNSLVTRAWLCEHAEQSIDIQYFIFATDNVGLIACDYLVRAADRGVKVRILVDDILVDAGPHELLTMDSHPNISIKIYNPGVNLGKNIAQKLWRFASNFKGANQRMHNKTFIVDGKAVITGGRNVADEYFDYDREFNFRDRDILMLGKETQQVNRSFEEFWNSGLSVPVTQLVSERNADYSDTTRFDRLHQYACNPDNFWPQVRQKIAELPKAFKEIEQSGGLVWVDSVRFVSDEPGKNKGGGLHGGGKVLTELTSLIKQANRTIDIQSPYLIVTEEGLTLLADAVKRGVKIRILTNSLASNDNLSSFGAYQRVRKSLLQAGVRIFEFRPDAKEQYKIMTGALREQIDFVPVFGLHAKTMVVDGEIVVVGTFNMDPRSANLNTECVTIVYSPRTAGSILKAMEVDYRPENAWETTLTFNPDKEAAMLRRVRTAGTHVMPKAIL